MLNDLLNHEAQLTKLLSSQSSNDWIHESQYHELCLYHLQRERLIHLLVTLTVALTTVAVCMILLFQPSILLGVLAFLLMCLLVPYLLHYQKLENTAQRWYKLSEAIREKAHESTKR